VALAILGVKGTLWHRYHSWYRI